LTTKGEAVAVDTHSNEGLEITDQEWRAKHGETFSRLREQLVRCDSEVARLAREYFDHPDKPHEAALILAEGQLSRAELNFDRIRRAWRNR
jgi:hypothetical protein